MSDIALPESEYNPTDDAVEGEFIPSTAREQALVFTAIDVKEVVEKFGVAAFVCALDEETYWAIAKYIEELPKLT